MDPLEYALKNENYLGIKFAIVNLGYDLINQKIYN